MNLKDMFNLILIIQKHFLHVVKFSKYSGVLWVINNNMTYLFKQI